MADNVRSYARAQHAIADLKSSVFDLLDSSDRELKNVDIGHSLGIYHGHEGHEGQISRTILKMLESDGVVVQNPESKKWKLAHHSEKDLTEDHPED